MKDAKYILNNWAIVHDGDSYMPPEHQRLFLIGDSSLEAMPEHVTPNRHTSFIVGIDGDYIMTYSGSRYRLGTVDPDYGTAFPNAKERLFETIQTQKAGD